ncbi:Uncharacterised protein [Candidatus Norongarragalina meridionalis]|nr:Uncharacterised protein [Candidatus Norongarragalina meridionalis]
MTILIGIAAVCLAVGSIIGYLYASQSQNAYLEKGVTYGCLSACRGGTNQTCVTECYYSVTDALKDPEYLQKAVFQMGLEGKPSGYHYFP